MLRFIKLYLKNSKAATAIEFAIIAPVFFLLLIGIIEVGLTIFYDSSLDTGIHAAARAGVPNGFTPSSNPGILDIMSSNLGGLYDPNRATFVVKYYNCFTDASFTADALALQTTGAAAFFNGGSKGAPALPGLSAQSGAIAVYGVQYDWGGLTQLLIPFIPAKLYAFSIVRNETFSGSTGVTCP